MEAKLKIAVLVISSESPPYPDIESAVWRGQPEEGLRHGVDVFFLRGQPDQATSQVTSAWLRQSALTLLELASSVVLALGSRGRKSRAMCWVLKRVTLSDRLVTRILGLNTRVSLDRNVIRVFCPERRSLIGWKSLRAFEFLRSEGYEFVFRTNSSSFVDVNKLKNLIVSEKFPPSTFFGKDGIFCGQPFHSGAGYLLGSEAMYQLLVRKSRWNHLFLEDVALSLLIGGRAEVSITHGPLSRLDISSLHELNECTQRQLRENFHFRLKTKDHRETVTLAHKFRERYEAVL